MLGPCHLDNLEFCHRRFAHGLFLSFRRPSRPNKVKALTLDTILKNNHPELKNIDALLIDVEGWELDVLKGFNIEQYMPKVMVLEMAGDNVKYSMNDLYIYMDQRFSKLGYVREKKRTARCVFCSKIISNSFS